MKLFKAKLLVVLLLASSSLFAQQTNDRRTLSTKIADLLAKFPVNDKKQYDANVEQLQGLGRDGLLQMISMLSPEGKGNNAPIEYAISAYSSSVMEGKQRDRNTAIEVYCESLKSLKDPSNLSFIIRQLQMVGNDQSLVCLAPFLRDERQAGPAARAIAQVKTDAAGKLLLEALTDNNAKDKSSIIEGLGYIGYAPAATAIQQHYTNANASEKKASLYALAHIADPASSKLLHDAAKAENFRLNDAGATMAYIRYIRGLAGKDKAGADRASKLATEMLTEATSAKNTSARIAALTLVNEINGSRVMPLVYKAMREENVAYRAAALNIAEKHRNAASNAQFITLAKSLSAPAKAQLIAYLSSAGDDQKAAAAIDPYLNDANDDVRHAAISAIPSIFKDGAAITRLVNSLKAAKQQDIPIIKNALLRVKAEQFGKALASQLDGLPAPSIAASLDVLAARRQEDAGSKTFQFLKHSDTTVSNAAYRALPWVVKFEDAQQLYPLLGAANSNQLPYVQSAISNSLSSVADTAERTKIITSQMEKGAAKERYLYAPVLASIAGRDALKAVHEIYTNGDAQSKRIVVEALSKNKDANSALMLLNIARNSQDLRNAAVEGYISIIRRGNFTADQKVLMLQEAMALASAEQHKRGIIQEAGRNQTYQSLLFAGRYLDDPKLQQASAFAVMNIALAHPEFNGNKVRELLQKVSDIIKGQDSQYQKEAIRKHLAEMPAGEGFVPLFNGKDLTGWKGLVGDPIKRAAMTPKALEEAQKKADATLKEGWQVKDGLLVFTGKGDNLATTRQYEDFEMLVDWKITPDGDAGIYLRGTPQVQIWDTARRDVGAQVGSGGLYNNEKNASKPLMVADNPVGEWNTFRIVMKGDKVTVYLNGQLVTDNVPLENFWDRKQPLFPKEQIELQAHGTYVAYRNIYVKELPGSRPFELPEEEKKQNFELLFNGTNLDKWTGNKKDYVIEGNELVIKPSEGGGGGNLFTEKEYGNFIFRFEFMLTPGANNGLAIRAPLEGDAAYTGMELQILDNDAEIYKDLKPYQYHGSVYGVIAAKRGFLKPIGEWNFQEVEVNGTKIKITLNGTVILDGDIKDAREKGTLDGQDHPGLKRDRGHIGFLGHGSVLRFRNIRVKEL